MSRNNDRLGLDHIPQQDETPAATTAAVGIGTPGPTGENTFNWSVPTEFVELPSEGVFYPTTHPLHNQKTVEIRFMTAKEEDILTSRSLLKEGVALDRMLQNIVVDKRIKISDLLVGDKNALLVAARRTGYGADYETTVTCPACDSSTEYAFDISEPNILDFRARAEENSININSEGVLEITLPMTKATVTCKLLTSADENKLLKEAERKQRRKIESSLTTDTIASFVLAVNGETNPFAVQSFIQTMPARDARELRRAYSEIVPNIDLTQNYDCSECGYSADLEVPLGLDFFWPN